MDSHYLETGMDLILWRHADAEDGVPDLGRKLTAKGEKQAQQMAHWLKTRLPEKFKMISSPAKRAQQTAGTLSHSFDTIKTISPGADAIAVLTAAGWPNARGAVVVVGHQPTLARVAAFLLAGEEADWSMKKGSLWWFTNRVRQGEEQTILRVMMSPEFV